MKIYLVEKYNLITLLFLIFSNRKTKIYLVGFVDFFPNHPSKQNIYERIGCHIFGDKHIVKVPEYSESFETESEMIWETNQLSLNYLEEFGVNFKNTLLGKYLTKAVSSPKISIAIKKIMLENVAKKILFYKTYIRMLSEGVNIHKIIPADNDRYEIYKYLSVSICSAHKSEVVSFYNSLAKYLMAFSLTVSAPYIVRDIVRKGVRLTRPIKKVFDTGIHVVFGFPSPRILSEDKMKKREMELNDALLVSKGGLDATRTTFIFSRWNFSREAKSDFVSYINQLGSNYVDEYNNRIPLKLLLTLYFKTYFKNIYFILQLTIKARMHEWWMIKSVQKLMTEYLNHLIFCQFYDVKVFVSRDDYYFGHITRTIAQNHFSNKNVGVQHSAFIYPKKIPYSAHVYFDVYYTAGEKFQELWSPYWLANKVNYPVGPQRDFSVLKSSLDNEIRLKYESKYNSKITILMLISKHDNLNSPYWLLAKKYKGVHKVLDIDEKLHLILRPRSYEAVDSFLTMCPELLSYIKEGRCTVELNDFTTQQLIPFVNILVSEDASSSLLESLVIDKLFSIFFMIRYGEFSHQKNMVVHDADELVKMITSYMKRGTEYLLANIQREYIKNNFVVTPGGYTWERMGKHITQLIAKQ